MVEKSGSALGRDMAASADLADLHRALADALRAAAQVMSHEDVEDAERSAKTISAIARAARDVNEVGELVRASAPQEDNVEELRAELRRRLALYVDADRAGAPVEVLERVAVEGHSGRATISGVSRARGRVDRWRVLAAGALAQWARCSFGIERGRGRPLRARRRV